MQRKMLVAAITATLALPLFAVPALAQDQEGAAAGNAEQLEAVTVTGSLIKRSQVETASPVITITNEEITKKGFGSVSDVLRALPQATGGVQGAQTSASFTQGAETLSLFGLDPGFTLYLIDGRPMADYPLLYNGSGNFVDISSIPMAMVERIDILPGNQSAIYGSDAIAGVVNIVLKQKMDGYALNLRVGGYSEGGGDSQRLQFTGGNSWDRFNLIYSLELRNQEPIYRFQRSWMDSTLDNPSGRGQGSFNYLVRDLLGEVADDFVDPGAWCDRVSSAYGGTVRRFEDNLGRGFACGSPLTNGYSSIMNDRRSANGYVKGVFDVNDNTQAYGSLMYNVNTVEYFAGSSYSWWGSGAGAGPFYDPTVGSIISLQHVFDSSYSGIFGLNNSFDRNKTYVGQLGLRGTFGDSNWDYDVYYHRSDNVVRSKQLKPLAALVDRYFLGDPVAGATDPFFDAYPVYNVNWDRFYSVITPDQYRSFSDYIRGESHTYTQKVNATVTNLSLFELPAGPVGFAALVEAGNQLWDDSPDPRMIAGEVWGASATQGYGKRDRYAIAAEMNAPLTSMLTATGSARYDQYKASGRSDEKFTYKLGLEFRPADSLLLRGTYATAFRAPDMAGLYQGESGFFAQGQTDYYRCREEFGDDVDFDTCRYNNQQISGVQSGNLDLKNVNAKSATIGVVWSPTANLAFKADLYEIKIDDQVQARSLDEILQLEADCRRGSTVGGSPVDINSPNCVAVLGLVDRNLTPPGPNTSAINLVRTYPINVSKEKVRGITANMQYRLQTASIGDFIFGADYNTLLKHESITYVGDPTIDELTFLSYPRDPKWRASASVTWNVGGFSTTVYGQRRGKTLAFNEVDTIGPWTTYNASVSYTVDDLTLSLISNNVTNKRPPKDRSNTTYPYYDSANYDAYGRSIFAEINYRFGGSGG